MHPPSPFALLAGIGMMLVAVLAVAGWWWRTRTAFKFFWWGALAWGIGVVLGYGLGRPASKAALPFFRSHLPPLLAGITVYTFLGVLSALVQIVVVWFLVSRTRLREVTANEAVGLGLGVGAIESLLLGGWSVFCVILGLTSWADISWSTRAQLAQLEGPLRIAVPIFERVWTIAGFVVGTLLVVWTVQQRVRWLWAALVFKVSLVALTTWSVDHFGLRTESGLLKFEAIGASYVALWAAAIVVVLRRSRVRV